MDDAHQLEAELEGLEAEGAILPIAPHRPYQSLAPLPRYGHPGMRNILMLGFVKMDYAKKNLGVRWCLSAGDGDAVVRTNQRRFVFRLHWDLVRVLSRCYS
jgi:hypothetical protein